VNQIIKIIINSLFFLILTSCITETEIWVDNSGGGTAKTKITGAFLINKDDIRKGLIKESFENITITDKEPGTYEVTMKWNDFANSFGTRRINEDGSITLGIKKLGMGASLKVHVNGSIIKERTSGNIIDDQTVSYVGGSNKNRQVTYMPKNESSLVIIMLCAGILIVIIILTVNHGIVETKEIETEIINDVGEGSENRFCTNCGEPLAPQNIFCKKCGQKIINVNKCP
jgi:hypothetical protein